MDRNIQNEETTYKCSNFYQINSFYSKLVFMPPGMDESYRNVNYHHKIKSKNGNLISYFEYKPSEIKYNYNSPKPKIIIWSHGNAMNSYGMEYYFKHICKITNVIVIAYDYQGYGFSEGSCSENNCYEDLEAIIEHVKNKYMANHKNIYLIGQSLGTGVIVDYISNHKWTTPVMLISPYKSIIRIMAPTLGNYVGWFDMFNSISKINTIKCPVKIIHGLDDDIVDISHGKDLYNSLPNKTLDPLWLKNCNHNNIIDHLLFMHSDRTNVFKELLNN